MVEKNNVSLTALASVLYSALNAKYSRDKKYIWHSKVFEDCPCTVSIAIINSISISIANL